MFMLSDCDSLVLDDGGLLRVVVVVHAVPDGDGLVGAATADDVGDGARVGLAARPLAARRGHHRLGLHRQALLQRQ